MCVCVYIYIETIVKIYKPKKRLTTQGSLLQKKKTKLLESLLQHAALTPQKIALMVYT